MCKSKSGLGLDLDLRVVFSNKKMSNEIFIKVMSPCQVNSDTVYDVSVINIHAKVDLT